MFTTLALSAVHREPSLLVGAVFFEASTVLLLVLVPSTIKYHLSLVAVAVVVFGLASLSMPFLHVHAKTN
jgi:hypothetical protein